MKDYASMSDREIGRLVAAATGMNGGASYNGTTLVVRNGVWDIFDPCNNPADAWPIIIENKISLMFDASTEEGNEAEWCLASSPCDQIIVDYVAHDKMLRAAMIVFLMMKESKND